MAAEDAIVEKSRDEHLDASRSGLRSSFLNMTAAVLGSQGVSKIWNANVSFVSRVISEADFVSSVVKEAPVLSDIMHSFSIFKTLCNVPLRSGVTHKSPEQLLSCCNPEKRHDPEDKMLRPFDKSALVHVIVIHRIPTRRS